MDMKECGNVMLVT